MRQYLLTEKERALIRGFLATGKKSDPLYVLLNRCRDLETVDSDRELISKLLSRINSDE